jgi:uncharacterized protein HemY
VLQAAERHLANGRAAEARAALAQAKRAGLDLTRSEVARRYYTTLGRAYLRERSFRAAQEALRKAAGYAPEDAALLLDYGLALETLGDREAARQQYLRARTHAISAAQRARADAALRHLSRISAV